MQSGSALNSFSCLGVAVLWWFIWLREEAVWGGRRKILTRYLSPAYVFLLNITCTTLGKRQRRYNYVLFPFSVRFETMQYVVRLACAFCTAGKFSTYWKFHDVHDVRPHASHIVICNLHKLAEYPPAVNVVPSMQHVLLTHTFIGVVYRQLTVLNTLRKQPGLCAWSKDELTANNSKHLAALDNMGTGIIILCKWWSLVIPSAIWRRHNMIHI